MPVHLSKARIQGLKPAPPGKRYEVRDGQPGLIVRVTATGHKTFMLKSRFPGSHNLTRRAIGDVDAVSLDQARQTARDWLNDLSHGLDPAERTKQQQAAEAAQRVAAPTFGEVAEMYVARSQFRSKRQAAEVERAIRKELLPAWGSRPLSAITHRDVATLIDGLVERQRAPSSAGKERTGAHARNVLGYIRTLYNWAISRDLCQASPCDRIRPKDLIGVKQSRERVLDDSELRALWRAADRAGYPFGPLWQLLLLLGARKTEVSDARWPEVNFQAALFTVPAARFKAGTAHVLPLAPDAVALLQALPRFRTDDFIFSTTFGVKPVDGFSKAKTRLDRLVLEELKVLRGADAKLEPWVIHDLRRTTRTRLSAICSERVAELIIGHGRKGIVRTYDLHTFLEEMRAALVAWSAKLRTITRAGV